MPTSHGIVSLNRRRYQKKISNHDAKTNTRNAIAMGEDEDFGRGYGFRKLCWVWLSELCSVMWLEVVGLGLVVGVGEGLGPVVAGWLWVRVGCGHGVGSRCGHEVGCDCGH